MLRHYYCWHWTLAVIILILVKQYKAQIPVAVTYNPQSPVEIGVTTFRCEFTLAAGDTLAEQYWQIVNGPRFFTHVPGSEPNIDPDYVDKIIEYRTDDTTYMEIYFDVTACDTEQYLCHILVIPSADEGQDQESLEVQNLVAPVIKYGSQIPESEIEHEETTTISCELTNAGPPLPELLELVMGQERSSVKSSSAHTQDSSLCTWYYGTPVAIEMPANLTEKITFECKVVYRNTTSVYSKQLILAPISNDGLSGGEIAGIAVGGVAFIVIVVVIIVILVRKNRGGAKSNG